MAIFLINATNATPNPHLIEISTSRHLNLQSAHVFVGVAVLGHHVSEINRGWLVKQKGDGLLHIDWVRGGDWNGLTRSEEGPRDVSTAQMGAVIHTIEGLGYPERAIRAWRVVAPVGHDGFDEGDKSLTIGEILVDIGTGEDARLALERWWNVILHDDPFEKIPLTNVRYSDAIYLQPDCASEQQAFHYSALAQAHSIERAIATTAHTRAQLTGHDATYSETILCPDDRRPIFWNVSGGPPMNHYLDLSGWQGARITYTLAGNATASVTAQPDELPPWVGNFEFDIAEPYAATFGSGSADLQPQAVVLHFKYDIVSKERKDYASALSIAQSHVTQLQNLVAPSNIAVKRLPAEDPYDAFDVFVYVPKSDFSRLKELIAVGRGTESYDRSTFTALVSDCTSALQLSVKRAMGETRRRAGVLASLMHAKIRTLGAARVVDGSMAGIICSSDPRASVSKVLLMAEADDGAALQDAVGPVAITATVDAAWTLEGIRRATGPLLRSQYQATASGTEPPVVISTRALVQAARQAIVDNPHIVSLFETEPSINTYHGSTSTAETLIVMR